MDKRIPNAEIRRVWMDQRLTTAEASAELGIARATLWRRAKSLGLPKRKVGARYVLIGTDLALFEEMWKCGVLGEEIAAFFGMHRMTVGRWVRRLDLPRRALGSRPSITVEQFKEELIGRIMKKRVCDDLNKHRMEAK